jgi:predicted phosphodiesterase
VIASARGVGDALGVLARLVLIGDIHGERAHLERVLAHAAAVRPDGVLAVGDLVDGGDDVVGCIERLAAAGVVAVRGNHERWLLDGHPLEPFAGGEAELAWLRGLPATRRLETVAGPLLLCHGVGAHDMQQLGPDDRGYALESNFVLAELLGAGVYRWMVGGHTHRPMIRSFARPGAAPALTVLNPGTLCRRDRPGFLEVDLGAGTGTWYGVDDAGVTPLGRVALAVDCAP